MGEAMEIVREKKGVLRLSGELLVGHAGQLRESLLEELNAGPELTLELSEVSQCDAAGWQLLFALNQSARAKGKTLRLGSPSMAMRESSAILGFSVEELAHGPQERETAGPRGE